MLKLRTQLLKKVKIFYCSLFLFNLIKASDLVINSPGVYQLNFDMISNPSSSGDIISINSSNVILDLSDHIITQTNLVSSVNGINVASGVSNVTIKNGTIKNCSGIGINISDGCRNIVIDSVNIDKCFLQGINIGYFSSTNIVSDVTVKNSKITYCSNSATSSNYKGLPPISLYNCLNCVVENCEINSCGKYANSTNDNSFASIYLALCNNCIVDNIIMKDNTQFGAVNLYNSNYCVVKSCIYSGATGNLAYTGGYCIQVNSSNNLIQDCIAQNNTASSNHGLFSIENSSNNILKNCTATLNNISGYNSNMFFVIGANQLLLQDCVAFNNSSTGQFYGFFISGANKSAFINCDSVNNKSNATAIFSVCGMIASGCSNSEFTNCSFYSNNGATDNLSFGLKVSGTSTNNIFSRISSYNNGPVNPISGNQMYNVPANQIVQ